MEGAVLSGKLCAKEINEYSRQLKLSENEKKKQNNSTNEDTTTSVSSSKEQVLVNAADEINVALVI